MVISVTDTGPGISPHDLARVFEPFQQGDETIHRHYGGSGLGLAISKRFVEMHGGRIAIESHVGMGTTVSFTLPIQAPLPEDRAKRWFSPYESYVPRNRASVAPGARTKPRIVVVDQGDTLCQLIERYAEDLEAIRIPSIPEASQAIETNSAVALAINRAPNRSPHDILAGLPTAPFDIPVISLWLPEPQARISGMGVQDYLIKPIQHSVLLDSIARVVPGARSILLAEDDLEAQQLFARMLASAEQGYVVFYATDGEMALKMLIERRPDLLLLDLVMPNGGGFAVLEAKKEDPEIREIPVIIISAKDPQREPLIAHSLDVTRQGGLSVQDLVSAIEALSRVLQPRIAAPAQPETLAASPAYAGNR